MSRSHGPQRLVVVICTVVALAIGMAGFGPTTRAAASDPVCNSSMTGIAGTNYTVPGGATCVLTGDARNITVQPNGNLILDTATVTGNVMANHPASFGIFDLSTVGGNVHVTGTTSLVAYNSTDFLCSTTIMGTLTIENSMSTAPWVIGTIGPSPYFCQASNTLNKVILKHNKGSIDVSNNNPNYGPNTIPGGVGIGGISSLTIKDNSGSSTNVSDSMVTTLKCSRNVPAPTDTVYPADPDQGPNSAWGGSESGQCSPNF